MLRKIRPNCLVCGRGVLHLKSRYCSAQCQFDHRYLLWIERWQQGLESGTQKPFGISNHIRRYLIEKHGEKCSLCGWCERNPVTKRVPLAIDHTDGNWQNCKEENLALLCPNCHALTPTFGALNKGNGRAERYKKSQILE